MTKSIKGISLDEFFASLDRLMAPIYNIAALKEQHREELKKIGIIKENGETPKGFRRKKGERHESDRGWV